MFQALGHLHAYQSEQLGSDGGVYCYPGCLEGRGFDECGEKGVYLGEAEKGSEFQFVRTGYFVRDTGSEGVVYNRVVALKESWKPGR